MANVLNPFPVSRLSRGCSTVAGWREGSTQRDGLHIRLSGSHNSKCCWRNHHQSFHIGNVFLESDGSIPVYRTKYFFSVGGTTSKVQAETFDHRSVKNFRVHGAGLYSTHDAHPHRAEFHGGQSWHGVAPAESRTAGQPHGYHGSHQEWRIANRASHTGLTMAETPPTTEVPKPNGMTGLLTELVKSGDNWIKLIIVGGLVVNGYLTKSGNQTTRTDVDKVQQTVAKQVRVIFTNQRIWASFADAQVQEHRLIMEKLGIPKEEWPRLPPLNFQQWSDETEEDNNQ